MKLSAAELERAFGEMLTALNRNLADEQIPWMVVGGIAVGLWTEPRATKDCDIALAVPADVVALESALQRAGIAVVRGDLEAARQGGVIRCTYAAEGLPALTVDILCSGTTFEVEALKRRRSATVLGAEAYVVSPDDLLLYKLIAGRPQDYADADKLVRFGRAPEDSDYVRARAREWDVEDRLDRVLRDAAR
jgi:hypothetical protein